MITANKRTAIIPKGLRYQKVTQTRVSNGRWLPKFGGMASASREKAFRHVWSKRGDRRLGFFQFRITRDDGTIIDHTLLTFEGIWIRQDKDSFPWFQGIGGAHGYLPEDHPEDMPYWTKEGDVWYYYRETSYLIKEFSYNTVTEIWTVPFYVFKTVDVKPKRGKKFWVLFDCEDSVRCMYVKSPKDDPEYIYQTDDSFATTNDYVRPDFYEVRVPYYKIISMVRNPVPEEDPLNLCSWVEWPPTYCYPETGGYLIYTVHSSIQYIIYYELYSATRANVWGKYMDSCSGLSCEECLIAGDASEERWLSADPPGSIVGIGIDVSGTTTHGDSSGNIETNPIDTQYTITPIPYTVEEGVYQVTITPNSLIYDLIIGCPGGEVTFELDVKIARSNYEVWSEPKLTP